MRPQVVYLSHAGPIAPADGTVASRGPLRVVADFADESCVSVQLPAVGWRDRASLLKRRLAQEFPDTPYRLALPVATGRAAQGPTHVLCALPSEPVDRFTQDAVAHGDEIEGIWSVALLAAWWLRRAGVSRARGLVVLRTPSGVRHVFLNGGVPAVSRLVADALNGEAASDDQRELERTVQYLRNMRLLGADERISAWAWGVRSDGLAEGKALQWQPGPALRGLPDPQAHGLPALLELLARAAPRTQFAPDSARVHWRARRTARALYAGAGACALLIIAGAALQAQLAGVQRAQLLRLERELSSAELRRAQMLAAYERAGAAPQDVTAALAAYEPLRQSPRVETALRAVAGAFSTTATWRLDEVHWQVDDASGAPDAGPCAATPGETAGAVLRIRGQTHEAGLRAIESDRIRFEAALRETRGMAFAAEQAPLALDAQPLRGGGDAPRNQPFAYCLRMAEASR
ncbi:MAG: hypothetical protein ACK4V1_00830 [Burkholderiaceae bacterium]